MLPSLTVVGIGLVALLVMWPALRAQWSGSTGLSVLMVALAIASYSAIDSQGVRLASPIAFIACQFLGAALLLTPWALRDNTPVHMPQAVGAGLMSVVSYLLILYAYQRTAAAPVLALRQMGIALAPWAGWLFLRERLRRDAVWISIGILVGSFLIVMG